MVKIGGREIANRQDSFMGVTQEPQYFNDVDLSTLKPKMKRFARHYMSTVNVAQSSEMAGYKSANHGHKLLKRADIQAYLQWLVDEASNANIASATDVLEMLTAAAQGHMEDEVVLQSGKKISKRIDSKDRIAAMGILSKFHGLQTEKVEISHEYNIKVDIDEVFKDDDEEFDTIDGEFEEVTDKYDPAEDSDDEDDTSLDDDDFEFMT